MRFNGQRKLILKFLSSLLFLFSSYAEDFGVALPGQIQGEDRYYEQKKDEDPDGVINLIMGDRSDGSVYDKEISEEEKKKISDDYMIPGNREFKKDSLSEKEETFAIGNTVPFQHENEETLIEHDNDEIYGDIYNKGESSFSFAYIMDNYDVTDQRGVFQKSFEDASGSKRGGSLHLVWDEFFNRGWVGTFYGFGAGIGYSEGRGLFVSEASSSSDVRFQLYSIPLDLRLGFEIVPSRYFKLSFAGGPSVLGLMQTRSDLDKSENGRYRRQVSPGYFGHAKLQISISAMASDIAFKSYSQSDITNMYLNLEMRVQNYNSFQDDVSISGASIGAGFTFEYF